MTSASGPASGWGRPAHPGAAAGVIDYRLARSSLLSEYRKGRLARHEVCDAHPELVRVARNLGQPVTRPCPVCEEPTLVLVSWVFGPRLPASGRVVTSATELGRVARQSDAPVCYVVEVCPDCSWNHLLRSFPVTRSGRRTPTP